MRLRLLWPALLVTLAGCAPEGPDPMGDDLYPVSDVVPLYEDAPADRGMSLAFDSKADETLPDEFDLIAQQSAVRNQGRRGTCSIFATTALMESLYISEGTIENPDFSEQFLQWSAKFEVNSFPNSSGSSASYNLQAINRFGIVEESVWPYESTEWGTSNDPACTGDSRPTRCYTNGEPTAEQRMAQRYTLPAGRWINPRAESLMGHMVSTRTPVVAGGDFFYQSWSHGGSMLTTNPEYARQGWVLSPNDEDVADSRMRPAGHAFLLVGFDQNLSVPRIDGMGNEIMGADGEPEMETGFFLFKNSWGSTGNWGSANPHGAGYGWISFRYVEEYLTAYVSGLPEVMRAEVCNDGRDNDRNGQSDCADAACAGDRACMDPVDTNENTTATPIPDNSPTGASSTITIAEGGTISSLAVTVDITHTYRGDLTVRLVNEAGDSATLIDQSGGSADDLQQTFTVADFNGTDAAGTWTLVVADNAAQDTGTLNSWRLDVTRCTTDCGGTAMSRTYTDSTATPIPDVSSVSRTLTVDAPGAITEMSVTVDITHSFPYELTIRLEQEGGRELILVTEDSGADGGIHRTFSVPGLVGTDAAGDYTLTVVDGGAGDTGTLDGWSIQVASH